MPRDTKYLCGYERDGTPIVRDAEIIGSETSKSEVTKADAALWNARQAEIVSLIAEQLAADIPKCVRDARLHEDLSADSLDMVELTVKLEEHYSIDISDAEAAACETVGDVVKLVEGKRNG